MQTEKINGVILRPQARFVEGENNSKFFFNLVKHMKAILNSNGLLISKPDEIRREQASFYHELYSMAKPI